MRRNAKTLQLQIRVAPQEKAAILSAARKAHMGISQWVLSLVLPGVQQEFQGLLNRLKTDPNPRYILAEIHDLLKAAAGDEFDRMVSQPPVSLPSYYANYVAAMVEYAATRKKRPAPRWTREVPPLAQPVFGSDLESLRLHLLTHSPPPFRCRNIFIDASVGERV